MIKRIIYFIKYAILRQVYRRKLCYIGKRSRIVSPLHIDGGKRIRIGSYCVIQYKTWIAAMPHTGERAELIIEDGCRIGNFNHIYATKSIILRKNVLTADKVYISDNLHGYDDINTPICLQPIVQNNEVEIGEGSWLGENVCVLGAKIGKHCVIGANSVVTRDIPDYSVAVGSPAIVIKQYDFHEQTWKKVNSHPDDKEVLGGGKFYSLLCAA